MKKLILLMMIGILLVLPISALDFGSDNYKEYNEKTRIVKIYDSGQLGEDNLLAEAQLKSELNVYALAGVRQVAEFTIKGYTGDYNEIEKAISQMKFYDKNNNNTEIFRDFTFKIKEVYYEDSTKKVRWLPAEKAKIDKEITIGLFTEVYEGDYIEWVFYLAKKEIFEWATWTSSLNVNLEAYYSFDPAREDSTVLDSLGNHNGVFNSSAYFQNYSTGIILNSSYFNSLVQPRINISNPINITGYNLTISAWINPTNTASYMAISSNKRTADTYFTIRNSEVMQCCIEDNCVWGGEVIANVWNHAVCTYNGTAILIYVNGILKTRGNTTVAIEEKTQTRLGSLSSNINFFNGSIDEVGIWRRPLSASEVSDLYNGGAGITYDLTSLTIIQSYPSDNYNLSNTNIMPIGCNFTSFKQNISSVKLNVYDSLNNLDYTNTITTTGYNDSYNASWTPTLEYDTYLWSCHGYGSKSVDSHSVNRTFNVLAYKSSGITYNTSTFESSYEGFSIIVNASSIITSPYFSYGGINYTATSISSGLNYTLSYTKGVPLVDSTTNKSIYFGWNQGVKHYSINSVIQQVNRTNFLLCNTTYNVPYLNLSFKDESSLSNIYASIPTSTFNYYIDDPTIYRTLTFVNTTANYNYPFCYSPSHKTLKTSVSIQYKNDTNYPQRIYNPTTLTLTNSTTNQVLYLLSSTDGLYVTFVVTSTLGGALRDVEITATRAIGSSTETVGTGTTDAAGLFTIWVNPDFSHTFTFSKTGYDTFIYTTNPTQSSYDVVLGRTGGGLGVTDYHKGIVIDIKPISPYLHNYTTYNFNYTISSSNWSLDSYGYVLRYGNNVIADTQSGTTSTGGFLSSNINVANQTSMIMDYFYVVNSTYINGTKIWIVEVPNDYSIKYLFTRISNYTDANLLGIKGEDGTDLFGKALLSVLILVIVTGTLSYKYGIASEAAIMGVMFGVVLFLDNMNFIPNPTFLTGSVQLGEILVYLTGALTIGMIFKEESY